MAAAVITTPFPGQCELMHYSSPTWLENASQKPVACFDQALLCGQLVGIEQIYVFLPESRPAAATLACRGMYGLNLLYCFFWSDFA